MTRGGGVRGFVFGAALAAMTPLPAWAGPNEDSQTCSKESGDSAISPCTRAIDSGRFSGKGLGSIFYNRGIEYMTKRHADHAITDHNEAIRLDPRNAKPFNNRGLAYQN